MLTRTPQTGSMGVNAESAESWPSLRPVSAGIARNQIRFDRNPWQDQSRIATSCSARRRMESSFKIVFRETFACSRRGSIDGLARDHGPKNFCFAEFFRRDGQDITVDSD